MFVPMSNVSQTLHLDFFDAFEDLELLEAFVVELLEAFVPRIVMEGSLGDVSGDDSWTSSLSIEVALCLIACLLSWVLWAK